MNERVKHVCCSCGTIVFLPASVAFRHIPADGWLCRSCRTVQPGDPDTTLTCIECGETFTFGGRDLQFFARQAWAYPQRCRPCRKQRAQERESA
jgi:hypothetical protein